MIDEVLAALRKAHDEYRVPNQRAISRRSDWERATTDLCGVRIWRQTYNPKPRRDEILTIGRIDRPYRLVLNPEFQPCETCPHEGAFHQMCGACPLPPGDKVWLKVPKSKTEED